MKKLLAILTAFSIIILIFSNATTSIYATRSRTNLLAQNNLEDAGKKIKEGLGCGEIGQKCCKKEIDLPKARVPSPDIPVLGTIIGIILTPINTFVSLGDPIISWVEDKFSSLIGREPCSEGVPSGTKDIKSCVCLKKKAFAIGVLCTGIKDSGEINKCVSCSGHGVWTAIGCVDFKLGDFIGKIFGIGTGLAGATALLCILYAAFILQTSGGNPERLKKAREYLTNCIIGLILIIFSVLILRIVGVNILGIPGFG